MDAGSNTHSQGIAVDVYCRRCGYNLRSLTSDANCPECATPVRHSIRGNWLRLSDPDWLFRLALGAQLLSLTAICLAIAILALGVIARYRSQWLQIMEAIIVCLSVGGVWGCWLLSTPDPATARLPSHAVWPRATRVPLVIGCAGAVLHWVTREMRTSPDLYLILIAAIGAAELSTVATAVALLQILKGLARRVPDLTLVRLADFLSWAFPIGAVASLCLRAIQVSKSVAGLRRMHDQIVNWTGPGPFSHPLRIAAGVAIVGDAILVIAFIAALQRLAYHLRRSAEERGHVNDAFLVS